MLSSTIKHYLTNTSRQFSMNPIFSSFCRVICSIFLLYTLFYFTGSIPQFSPYMYVVEFCVLEHALVTAFSFEIALDRAWLSSVTVCDVPLFLIEVFLSDESGKNDVIDEFLTTFSCSWIDKWLPEVICLPVNAHYNGNYPRINQWLTVLPEWKEALLGCCWFTNLSSKYNSYKCMKYRTKVRNVLTNAHLSKWTLSAK